MNLTAVARPDPDEVLAILSVAELKLNERITHSVEDEVFRASILAAYDWLAGPENGWLNRSLITQQFTMTGPGFVKEETYSNSDTGGPATRLVPTTVIEIPMPPLQTVDSVKYLSSAVQETLDPDDYVVVKGGRGFGRLSRAYGVTTWPTMDTHPETLEITFTAGYGDGETVKELCPGIVQAMKLLAGDAYRNREDTYAEPRLVAVNRQIINGVKHYAGRYRFTNRYA